MKHLSETDCVDFVRNVVPAQARMAMQQHLQSGCEECAVALRLWHNVGSIAEQEKQFAPGEDTVRVVKSFVFAPTTAKTGVRLIFDSDLQPATSGIRGSFSARQLLYATDDYYVDLRFEPHRESDRACLVGQILSRSGNEGTKGLSVRMQQGKQSIAETVLNQHGEFQFEYGADQDLYILISKEKENDVVLPLYDVRPSS